MVKDGCTVDIHISPFCCTCSNATPVYNFLLYVIPLLILLLCQRARVLYHVLD